MVTRLLVPRRQDQDGVSVGVVSLSGQPSAQRVTRNCKTGGIQLACERATGIGLQPLQFIDEQSQVA